jgi:hypothetical protein
VSGSLALHLLMQPSEFSDWEIGPAGSESHPDHLGRGHSPSLLVLTADRFAERIGSIDDQGQIMGLQGLGGESGAALSRRRASS